MYLLKYLSRSGSQSYSGLAENSAIILGKVKLDATQNYRIIIIEVNEKRKNVNKKGPKPHRRFHYLIAS